MELLLKKYLNFKQLHVTKLTTTEAVKAIIMEIDTLIENELTQNVTNLKTEAGLSIFNKPGFVKSLSLKKASG